MGKRFSLALAAGVLLAALSAAPGASAMTAAQDCLQTGNTVCAVDGASISNSGEVQSVLQDKAVVVVVVGDDSNSLNPSQSAAQLAQGGGVEELILVVDRDTGSDRFGVYSSSGKQDEILTALNQVGLADGGEAIIASDVASIYSESVASDNGASGTDVSGLLGLIGGSVLGIAAVMAYITVRRKRKQKDAPGRSTKEAELKEQLSVGISEELRGELASFATTIDRYSRSEEHRLRQAASELKSVHGHVYELFKRIDEKSAKQSKRIADVRYLNIARKLNRTLSESYFEDIVRNPQLWDKSEEKLVAVHSALKSVDAQIIENIKQVNSAKEIEFQVALDSITQKDDGNPIEEIFGR